MLKNALYFFFGLILIGEVWLASGQSNMEWKMNQCELL